MLGDEDKRIEIVYGEEKNILCTGPTRAAKAGQKSLVTAWQAQGTNQEKNPFHCTLWVPITSASTVSRGHSFLASLVATVMRPILRHSGTWVAADEEVLNIVLLKNKQEKTRSQTNV
jgi:hypothetical protein